MTRILFLIIGILLHTQGLFALGRINGTVTDASSRNPVSGAMISLFKGSTLVSTTTTNSSGSYSITVITAGQYIVKVSASGFQDASSGATVITNQTTIVNFALQGNPGSIAGTVIDFNTSLPISGAVIEVIQNDVPIASTTTDASGNYSLGGLASGSYDVTANATNYQESESGAVVQPDQTTTVNFALKSSPGTISGTVTDANTSLPIQGAAITVSMDDTPLFFAATDASGNYTITGVPPGSYNVEAQADNYETGGQDAIVQVNQTTTVNFALAAAAQGGILSGNVTDATTSLPIQGASVEIIFNQTIAFSTLTDPSGNYTIDGVPAGSYVVIAHVPTYQTGIVGAIIQESQTTTVNFALSSSSGTVLGTVTDANTGLPISGAIVNINLSNFPVDTAETNASGEYLIQGVQPNIYTMSFEASGYQIGSQDEVVVNANQTTTVNMALQSTFGNVAGTVRSAMSGLPISGATIDAILNRTVIGSSLSSISGNYTIPGLAPGSYEILATAANFQTAINTITILASQTTTQNFLLQGNPSTLQGQVVNAITGSPLPEISVQILTNGSLIATALTDSNGNYSISTLPPGSYQVIISGVGYYTLSEDTSITLGEIETVNFMLTPNSPPRNLTGKAIDNRFLLQKERVHLIRWQASEDPTVLYYQIYRNGSLIATVSADDSLQYEDHNRSSKVADLYSVNDVNSSGNVSSYVSITLR